MNVGEQFPETMEGLVREDEDEEERKGKDNYCIKEERQTDSRTHLSVSSDKDDVDRRRDNKLPVTNLLCGTKTDGVQRQEEPPAPAEEKRFMVYICGGYKGKTEQIQHVYSVEHILGSVLSIVLSQSSWDINGTVKIVTFWEMCLFVT